MTTLLSTGGGCPGAPVRAVPLLSRCCLLLLTLAAPVLVGCGASSTLMPIDDEKGLAIKTALMEPTSNSSDLFTTWLGQIPTFANVSAQQLSDSRTMVSYIDDYDDEQTTYVVKMFGPALNQVWSVQKVLGPTMAVIAMNAENDRAHLLAVKYNEDADEDDSVRLVRLSFGATDGKYIGCDTLARTRGILEVDNNADSGYKAYRTLRSPDSSKILAYQIAYQYEHEVTKGRINALVLDRSFNVIYGRVIDFPVPSLEFEPDPDDWEGPIWPSGMSVDDNGGIYVATVEAAKTLRVSYYPDRDGVARSGAYKLDVAPFRRLYEDDLEDMGFSNLALRVEGDHLLVGTRVQEEEEWLGQSYGLLVLEYPRATMEPKVRVLHPFDEPFAERLNDDDEVESMYLQSVIPFADGSLVAFFNHVDLKTYTVGKGLTARTITITELNRLGAAHYSADGKLKWVGSIDDDYYGMNGESWPAEWLSFREFARDDKTIDLVHSYVGDAEFRTISFDASRDTLIIGRSIAEFPSNQRIPKQNLLWSSPSRLTVLINAGDEYGLNLIETTDGKPLFAPRNLDD